MSEQIRVSSIFFDSEHLWGLRRALGGHVAHAVPLGAAWVDGIALCGFQPSGNPKYIAERHGWESWAAEGIRPCPKCQKRAPGFFRRRSTWVCPSARAEAARGT